MARRRQRVVTLRELRGGVPGRLLLATSDPSVVRAVERALREKLSEAQPLAPTNANGDPREELPSHRHGGADADDDSA